MPCPAVPDRHTTSRSISLCVADPDLVAGIPKADLPLARRALVAPRLDLRPATWDPGPAPRAFGAAPSLLLTRGLVARNVRIGDRLATQLLGPGDVIDPWIVAWDDRHAVEWTVHEEATAAVLDARFTAAACRWPSLSAVVHARMSRMAARLAAHLAICQLARVDQRVLGLLWELADRFGRVTPGGVVLDLRLTHALLGQLIGAKRPTVTLAVGSLIDAGAIERRADGGWVLRREVDRAEPQWVRPGSPVRLAAA
jgi:CRP/FNR family transcriptional regulator, cyclic AMP receptor protein